MIDERIEPKEMHPAMAESIVNRWLFLHESTPESVGVPLSHIRFLENSQAGLLGAVAQITSPSLRPASFLSQPPAPRRIETLGT